MMRFRHFVYNELMLFAAISLVHFPLAEMGTASPYKFRLRQPNGNLTPYLMAYGGPGFHYMTDVDGYMVMENDDEAVVYAKVDDTTGSVVPSEIMVGSDDPKSNGVPKEIVAGEMGTRRLCVGNCNDLNDGRYGGHDFSQSLTNSSSFVSTRRLDIPPVMKNLVILVRFANHKSRSLPPAEDFDILFNKVGGDPIIAPTGSLRDVFTTNSYGKFVLESTIVGWLDLSKSEAYYADGTSGFNTDRYFDALDEALDILDQRPGFSFEDFDADSDGRVDMVTLLHSGYAAEVPGADIAGVTPRNRIWSHRWSLPSSRRWTSRSSGIQVSQYSTSPSIWGLTGDEIGRIGVIAHEIAHCLDLPDLYGTISGHGIGSYDLLSNHWGFGPYALRQYYPPIMSPWSKNQVGWIEPTPIVTSGRYSIRASATHDMVYRIDIGELGTEYLLIENRQKIGYDSFLPQSGLAIWHIDDAAQGGGGFPGQAGWPGNGKHYRVALLQADGNYDLERGLEQGDEGDLFHKDGVSSLLPSESVVDGPFPNTDGYQGGFLRRTGIKIFDISESGVLMAFSVDFELSRPGSGGNPPTSSPVANNQPSRALGTTFAGGNGAAGNMFDIEPLRPMTVYALDLHTNDDEVILVEVWSKQGSYVGSEQNPLSWTRLLATTVHGQGRGKKTTLTIGPIYLEAGEIRSFYVSTLGGSGLRYTNGVGAGNVAAINDDLIVYEGVGKPSPFGYSFKNRIWNGAFHYNLDVEETTSPSFAPSLLVPRKVETTFAGGTGQSGNMFDVFAYKTLSIVGLDVHLFNEKEVILDVYTKQGTLVGFENDCSEWSMVTSIRVYGAGMGKPTFLDLESSSILVPGGSMQAFYITLRSGTGIRYSMGGKTGDIYTHDDYLAVYAGVGKSYPCLVTFPDRVWNGAVHYVPALGYLSPSFPGYSVPDQFREIETTFIGEGGTTASMFNLHSKRGLSLVGFGVHINTTAPIRIDLYSFHGEMPPTFEPDSSLWDTVLSIEVFGTGEEQETNIPLDGFTPVVMNDREVLSFYIRLAVNGLGYSSGFVGLVVPTSNDDLLLSSADQTPNEIVTSNELQMWKAVFRYLVVDM